MDAAPNDIIQMFGIPLSGGTNVPVVGADAFSMVKAANDNCAQRHAHAA